MIIKGQARGRARQLAAHLLRADENECIRLYECRGMLAQDVESALIEMEARGMAARTQRPLYHASISPEPGSPLTDDQIRRAVDLLEERLGLHGQPRVVVLHRKKQREHVHVVWSRIEAESGVSIPYSWNYRLHEQASRELEAIFGHRAVHGSHAVSDKVGRSPRPAKEYEHQQAARSGMPLAQVADAITALWNASRDGEDFRRKLEEAGYVLARGDRRVFVVIDRAGEVHSLARRIRGADTAPLRSRLAPLDLDALPSVAEAKRIVGKRHAGSRRAVAFNAAAAEVGRPASELRTGRVTLPKLRAVLDAPAAFRQATRPQAGTGKPIRMPRGLVELSAYRSARATIIGDYASKIAAARCHAPRDQLDAVLAALYAERRAALDALARKQDCEARGRRKRPKERSGTGRAFQNIRLRPKRRNGFRRPRN